MSRPWPLSRRGLPQLGWAWALALHGAALAACLGALVPASSRMPSSPELAVVWASAPAPWSAEESAEAEPAAASPEPPATQDAPVPPLAVLAPPEPAETADANAPAGEGAVPDPQPHAALHPSPAPSEDASPQPVAEAPREGAAAAVPPAPMPTTAPGRRPVPVRTASFAPPPDGQRRRSQAPRALGDDVPAAATASPGPAPEGLTAPASASAALLPDAYKATLGALLRRGLRYPPSARDRDEEGDVIVAFSVARDGTVRGARVVRSSGISAFDQEALALLARISPAPPLPSGWAAAEAAFVVPVRFQLR